MDKNSPGSAVAPVPEKPDEASWPRPVISPEQMLNELRLVMARFVSGVVFDDLGGPPLSAEVWSDDAYADRLISFIPGAEQPKEISGGGKKGKDVVTAEVSKGSTPRHWDRYCRLFRYLGVDPASLNQYVASPLDVADKTLKVWGDKLEMLSIEADRLSIPAIFAAYMGQPPSYYVAPQPVSRPREAESVKAPKSKKPKQHSSDAAKVIHTDEDVDDEPEGPMRPDEQRVFDIRAVMEFEHQHLMLAMDHALAFAAKGYPISERIKAEMLHVCKDHEIAVVWCFKLLAGALYRVSIWDRSLCKAYNFQSVVPAFDGDPLKISFAGWRQVFLLNLENPRLRQLELEESLSVSMQKLHSDYLQGCRTLRQEFQRRIIDDDWDEAKNLKQEVERYRPLIRKTNELPNPPPTTVGPSAPRDRSQSKAVALHDQNDRMRSGYPSG